MKVHHSRGGGFGRGLRASCHFTLFNKKLNVPVDHKPLLKFLGDRELADIDNPRILNLKEEKLCWRDSVEQVKNCKCDGKVPGCCNTSWHCVGWKQVHQGRRVKERPGGGRGFGRGLGLHKTRHFTLGNKKLNVPLDHKPLLKFLGDRELGDIENPMILNLKEKTLCWRFSMEQVPGKDHHVANAMSWFPEKEPVIDDSWKPWGTSR